MDKHVVGREVREPEGVYLVHELGKTRIPGWSEEKTRNETDMINAREQDHRAGTRRRSLRPDGLRTLLKQAIAEAEAMFNHPHKQYVLFKDFEEKVEARETPGLPSVLDQNRHAAAYYGALRLVLGDAAFAAMGDSTRQEYVELALAIDAIVHHAIAENSLSPQNIEAAVRKALLPNLFALVGLDQAEDRDRSGHPDPARGVESCMNKPVVPETGWSFHYGSEIVHFAVRRQTRRRSNSIIIHVEPEGTVVVDAPVEASRAAILAAVRKRGRWIQGHLGGFIRRRAHILPREYVSGESVMYLGRRYRLKVIPADAAEKGVKLRGGYLEIRSTGSGAPAIRDAMERWFRARARMVFARTDGVHVVGTPLKAAVATHTASSHESSMGQLFSHRAIDAQSLAGESPAGMHRLRHPA